MKKLYVILLLITIGSTFSTTVNAIEDDTPAKAKKSETSKKVWDASQAYAILNIGYGSYNSSAIIGLGAAKNFSDNIRGVVQLNSQIRANGEDEAGQFWAFGLHANVHHLFIPSNDFKVYALAGIALHQTRSMEVVLDEESVKNFPYQKEYFNQMTSHIKPGFDLGVGVELKHLLTIELKSMVTTFSTFSLNFVFK